MLYLVEDAVVTDGLSRQTRLRGDTLLVRLCGDESNLTISHCAYRVGMVSLWLETYQIIVHGRLDPALVIRGFRRKEVKLSS